MLTVLLLLSLETPSVSADEPDQNGLFADAGIRQAPFADDETVIRSRFVKVNFDMLGGADGPSLDASAVGQRLPLNFFGDATFIAVMDRLEQNPSGSYTWIGHLEEVEHSQVILVVNGDLMIGKVSMPQGIYEIRYRDNQFHAVLEIDQSAFPSEEQDTVEIELSEDEIRQARSLSATDDGSVIDVLVVYTQDAKAGAGSTAAIESTIELAVAETNQAYTNSDVNQRLFLVHMEEVAYTESGSSSTDLNRFKDTGDGVIDHVLTLRNTYHADNAVLITEDGGGFCGIASLMTTVSVAFQSSAYGVVARSCATGNYSFGHELGHNMGLRHDWYVDDNTTPFSYSHGYVNSDEEWRTMMAYNTFCSSLSKNCTRLPYVSNPSINYNGNPMGVAGGTSTACTRLSSSPSPSTCDADNHLTLNTTGPTVAQWRASEIVWTGATSSDWNTASNWTMQEGAPGSTSAVQRMPRFMDNVSIPSGTPNAPLISTGTANARDISIATSATLNMSGGTLNVYGHLEEAGTGQFNGTGGTVVLKSNLDQTVNLANGKLFNLQVGDSTTQKVTLASNLDVNGDFTLQAGVTFEAGSHTINVAGNWNDGGNGFVSGTSTVIFDGSTQTADKVTSTTVLSENFNSFTSCCSTAIPSGWVREKVDGFGFATGELVSGNGSAVRWADTSDAWLFTSALALQPGLTYEIEYKYATSGGTSDFRVYLGTSQSSSNMLSGTLIDTQAGVSSSSYQTGASTFTVPTAGNYYLGFRNQRVSSSGYGLLDDITLRATQYLSFNDLTINSEVKTTFNENVAVGGNLLVSGGVMDLTTNELTVEGTVTNNAGMEQSRDVSSVGTAYSFLMIKNAAGNSSKYYGVQMTPDGGAGLGSTSVRVDGNQTCTTSGSDSLLKRCFDITPTTSNSATIKFWWLEAERNGQSANGIKIWDYNSSSWVQVGTTGTYGETGTSCTSDDTCWAQWTGISTFSPMVLGSGSAPTGTPGRGGSSAGVSLASDMEKSGAPGSTVEYSLQVVNTGSVSDTFTLTSSGHSWTTALSATSTGSLNPGESYTVTTSVSIPAAAESGTTDTATIMATSSLSSTINASVMLTTTAVAPSAGVDLPATQSGSAVVGDTASYSVELVNTGNLSDTFDLTISGNSWTTTLSPTSVGVLAPGASATVQISVTVAAGATDTASIKATSQHDATISDTLSLTTTAIASTPGVGIASSQVLTGVMGSTVNYTLQVSNTGNIEETFNLSVADNAWDTTVSPSSVVLKVNEQKTVTASVKIPVTATNAIAVVSGTNIISDTATIYVVSSSTPSISDTVSLNTRGERLIISPLQNQPAFAGPYNGPSKITVEVRKPADGLTKNNFTVDISGAATIVTLLELADRYKLDVIPPTQPANGLYDLKVEIPEALTTPLSDTESLAVQYADQKRVDVMLILDRSGSMGTTDMNAAKDASKQFVDFMGTGDMIGVGSFDDDTRVDFHLAEITSTTKTNAKTAIDPITSGGGTSIGGGLQIGQSELTTRGKAEDAWAIVLLSDGQHNTDPSVESVLPDIVESKTIVHTIGLGSGADEATMLDIASQTGGTYNLAPSSSQLGQVYNTILGAISNKQKLKSVSGTLAAGATDQIDVIVDSSISEATFSVTWSGSGTIELTLESPSGSTITEAVASGDANIEYVSGSNYAYYRVSSAETGTWKMFLKNGTTLLRRRNAAAIDYQSEVTADSNLTLDFNLEKDSYQQGDVIKMIATLSDQQPITGATVVVTVTNPSSQSALVTLFDDGVHDDGSADDGVYANNFGGTTESGTYNFSVSVTGTSNTRSPNASSFSREASDSTSVAQNSSGVSVADLSLSASASADSVSVGENVTYSIFASNNGPSDATNVVLTSQLPTGMSYVSSTTGQGSCSHSSGTVTCNLGTLSADAATSISIVAQASQAGTLSHDISVVSSDVSDSDASNNSTSVSVTVGTTTTAPTPTPGPGPGPAPNADADLAVSLSNWPSSAAVGDRITFVVNATNLGPNQATNVVFVNTLPVGVSFVSATTAQGTCSNASNVVTCNLGTLSKDASSTMTIVVDASVIGSFTNQASLSSDMVDYNSGNSSTTDSITISAGPTATATATATATSTPTPTATPILEADLSLSKDGSPDPVMVGETLTYNLTVANAGPADASNVTVVDNLPTTHMTFVSATASQGTCDQANGTVTCQIGALANGSQATVTIVVTANQMGQISNSASVTADQSDPNSSNNNATASTAIGGEQEIDPTSGGTLTWIDGSGSNISIEVPAGAVESETTMLRMIPTVSSSEPPNFSSIGVGFTLDAYQGGAQVTDFTFNGPVIVTITYTDANVAGLNENALLLHYWHEAQQQWIDAATSCNPKSIYQREPNQNQLTVAICHLTEFAFFAPVEGDIPTAISLGNMQINTAPRRWLFMISLLMVGSLLFAWRRRK